MVRKMDGGHIMLNFLQSKYLFFLENFKSIRKKEK